MTALIMAGGYATRMYPLTLHRPKALLPVQGKPILTWIVEDLSATRRVQRIVVVTNAKFGAAICEWAQGFPQVDVLTTESDREGNRKGAIADAVWAIDMLKLQDDVLILAADNLLEDSLGVLLAAFRNSGCRHVCVFSYPEADPNRLSKTGVADIVNGEIVHFSEKPASPRYQNAIPPYYIYPQSTIRMIKDALKTGCCPDSPGYMIEWLYSRVPIKATEMSGHRYNCGSLEGYEHARSTYPGILYR